MTFSAGLSAARSSHCSRNHVEVAGPMSTVREIARPKTLRLGRRNEDRLDSWKEIAVYLRREVRTVQRWERFEDLPVRRLFHRKGSSVYAFCEELDTWLEGRERGRWMIRREGKLAAWPDHPRRHRPARSVQPNKSLIPTRRPHLCASQILSRQKLVGQSKALTQTATSGVTGGLEKLHEVSLLVACHVFSWCLAWAQILEVLPGRGLHKPSDELPISKRLTEQVSRP